MCQRARSSIPDRDIRLAAENRRHEERDVRTVVLIIAVHIYDDIGAHLQRRIDTCLEGSRQSSTPSKAQDSIDAETPSGLGGTIVAAVIDDHHSDPVDSVDVTRDRRQRLGKMRSLVVEP